MYYSILFNYLIVMLQHRKTATHQGLFVDFGCLDNKPRTEKGSLLRNFNKLLLMSTVTKTSPLFSGLVFDY